MLAENTDQYLESLNAEQRRAVEHGIAAEETIGSPLLVIAGAGSGKTNTLAHRVAHLIIKGADPRRMLLMTFSRRAAAEMTQRIERIARRVLGDRAGIMTDALTWAGTFHGIGARLLREYAESIGFDPAFTIHDREDSADLLNLVRHELGFSRTENRFPTKGTCLAIYSRCVNAQAPIEAVLGQHYPWCSGWADELKQLFAGYVEAKQKQNVLDYDDLLLWWAQMVSEPAIAQEIGGRFDHVMVDEYQDTNRLQATILLALKPDGRGLTVVGDDAQSIYSFRAATIRNILDFPDHFSPRAEIVTLDRNYRSTQPVLAAANGVIGLARERFTKNLWTERTSARLPRLVTVRDEADQARYIVEQVLSNREEGSRLKEQAVLFRTSSHSGPLEVELTRRNIPFVKFGGLKFLDAAHVKDVLALLKFVENPRDRVAGFRVLHLLPGIGPASAQRILDQAAAAADPLSALAALPTPPRAGQDWTGFRRNACQSPLFGMAVRHRTQQALVYPSSGAHSRGCRGAAGRPAAARADRFGVPFPRTLSDRTHAGSAGCDQRSRRPAAARRRLSDPVHDPLGEGSGMEVGLCHERRRRLHAVRSRRRHDG